MRMVLLRQLHKALLVLPFLALMSCSTQVKTTDLTILPRLHPQATGFVFSYKFRAEDQIVGQDGCAVVFKNISDNEKIELKVSYGKEFLYVEAKPGIYALHDFSCGRYNWTLSESTWAQFHVEGEKISLIAPVEFSISDTRRISVEKPNRQSTKSQVLTIWGLLSDEIKKDLISGYTLKSINGELVHHGTSWDKREVSLDGEKFRKVGLRNFVNFRSCYASEREINGLWLGEIKVGVEYRKLQTPLIEIEDSLHTFSDHFIECVKSRIAEDEKFKGTVKRARLTL